MAFARYGFNVPHALSYGAIGYVMMKLRTYHPAQFIAASLRGACDKDIAQLFMTEAQRLGVTVHPPHVNYSGTSPRVHDGQVWLHFSATKQVGDKAALEIAQHAPYTDFDDFLHRIERRTVNKRVIKNMMLVDAFSGLAGVVEKYATFEVDPAQVNDRKVVLELLDIVVDSTIPDGAAQTIREKQHWSTDTHRRHATDGVGNQWRDDRGSREKKDSVTGGMVVSVRRMITRNGTEMAFVGIVTPDREIAEALFWPQMWGRAMEFISPGVLVMVRGSQDTTAERKIIAQVVGVLDETGVVTQGIKEAPRR